MSQSIKKNFIYNILLNISSVIFPLITAPYVSRVLEPEGIGIYNFSMTYAGYFALVALLGLPTYGVREVSKVKENKEKLNKLVSQLLTIVASSTLIVSFVYVILLLSISQLRNDYIYFLIAGFTLYLTPFQINWFYQGIEKFEFITVRYLIIKAISVICLFIFVRTRNDLIYYILISVGGTILADVWNYLKMKGEGLHPKITLEGLGNHIRPMVILFSSSVAVSVYTVLDTIMLGFMREYEEVGYYSNAMTLSKSLLVLVTSLSVVSVPRFSSYISKGLYDEANILANRSFSFVGLLAFPMSIGMICIAPVFVPWFWGEQFLGTVRPLQILSLLEIAIGFSNILGIQILVGIEKDRYFLKGICGGTISNFILNLILIPLYGAVGASIASVIAEFIVTLLMFIYIYRETPIRVFVYKDIIKSFIGSLLFIPLFFVFPKLDSGIIYIISTILLASILYAISQQRMHNSLFVVLFSQLKNKIIHKNN